MPAVRHLLGCSGRRIVELRRALHTSRARLQRQRWDPNDVGLALTKAIDVVMQGEPALVDIVAQPR